MTFADLVVGDTVFVDANSFVYCLTQHPTFGTPCKDLLERIEHQEFSGYTSAHILAEVSHKLMTLEASQLFGWPLAGMANRLKRHPAEVQKLRLFRQAIDELALLGIHVNPVSSRLVSLAADVSLQTGLLTGDALTLVSMRESGVTKLASSDGDFDRVPGITRYAPS